MKKNSGSALQGVILTLLVISVCLLYSYNKELAAQRTPEQTAQLELQIQAKKNIEAMKSEQEEIMRQELIALKWSELTSINQFFSKVAATRAYLFLLFPVALTFVVLIMRRAMNPI